MNKHNSSKMNAGWSGGGGVPSKMKEKPQRGMSEHFEQIFVELDNSFEH